MLPFEPDLVKVDGVLLLLKLGFLLLLRVFMTFEDNSERVRAGAGALIVVLLRSSATLGGKSGVTAKDVSHGSST